MIQTQPIIGITTSISEDERTLQLNQCHTRLLFALGALPILLPATAGPAAIAHYADLVDGVMFTGGNDVDPVTFGEWQSWQCGSITPQRDRFELTLCRELAKRPNKAVLGICRGFQVMNIALGGDIHQDIREGLGSGTIAHRQKQLARYASHPVALTDGSKLRQIAGAPSAMVNSLHHQAVRRMAEGFRVTATAPDGVIEAAELDGHAFFVGVQWHPELLWPEVITPDRTGEAPTVRETFHGRLFEAFVQAARDASK